jgi:hypothetical protein
MEEDKLVKEVQTIQKTYDVKTRALKSTVEDLEKQLENERAAKFAAEKTSYQNR